MSRFKTRFKQEIKISPREYINLEKIKVAEKMLKDSNYTITDIALSLSFSTSNYFAVLFKQVTGFTPTEYRIKSRH